MGDIQGEYLNEILDANGFRYLDSSTNTSIKNDAEYLLQIIDKEKITTVIVDDKILDFEWEGLIRPYLQVLAVIDDRPKRKHDVDILISPNLYKLGEKPFEGLVPIDCKVFIGPSSLPLRPEFMVVSTERVISESVNKVGSFFGGTDPGNQSGLILELAKLPQYSNLEFDLVTGNFNPMNFELFQTAKNMKNVTIRTTVSDMAKFWSEVDVAFGSYGISTWERCALGVPSVTSIQNEDQILDAEILEDLGAVLNLGYFAKLDIHDYSDSLDKLLSDRVSRQSLSESASFIMSDSDDSKNLLLKTLVGIGNKSEKS